MTGKIIEAKGQFGRGTTKDAGRTGDDQERRAEVLRQRSRDAAFLRKTLQSTKTLAQEDRMVLARNLGRLLERGFKGKERAAARQLFIKAYGEEGGRSQDKKRKRTIRFADEPLSLDDTYTAHGSVFLKLIEAFAEIRFDGGASDEEWTSVLLECLNGTSLTPHSGPRLSLGGDARRDFERLTDQILDSLALKTDIVSYLEEISKRYLHVIPSNLTEMSVEELASIHIKDPVIRAMENVSEEKRRRTWAEKIQLDGLGGPGGQFFPNVTIARLYMPRTVLCFDSVLPEEEYRSFNARRTLDKIIADAKAFYLHIEQHGKLPETSVAENKQTKDNETRERLAFERTVARSGFEVGEIDWAYLENPITKEAPVGMHWRVYWQAHTLKLTVRADGVPENLRLGFEVQEPGRLAGTRELAKPEDDDDPEREIENVGVLDLAGNFIFPWYPVDGGYHACRGLRIELPDEDDIKLEDTWHPLLYSLEIGGSIEVNQASVWQFLNTKMTDWKSAHATPGGPGLQRYPRIPDPALRLLFDAPEGYSPAPEDTLASAVFRSLAYAKGPRKLDEMLIDAVNTRVSVLSKLKEKSEREFKVALRQHGYEL